MPPGIDSPVAVQAAILLSVIEGQVKDSVIKVTDSKEMLRRMIRIALHENWMEPPAPGQIVLGTCITGLHRWLREQNRIDESAAVLLEAKLLFALMNNAQGLGEILQEHDPDTFTPIGIRPIWEETCLKEGYDPMTAQPVRVGHA